MTSTSLDRRGALRVLAGTAAALGAPFVSAQAWPSKPVTIVVPSRPAAAPTPSHDR
jgi:tripartite-type tricarboxylate transporter receptor subunit TctC